VKNRMREICTSGSVRGGGGNVLTYSALGLAQRCEEGGEGSRLCERGVVAEEREGCGLVGGGQLFEEQAAEAARKHPDGEEKVGPAGSPVLAIG